MIRNKQTLQILTRLITAVFLFVLIISPMSVYAQDSSSDNEADEEFETWSDALADSDYTDNLVGVVAKYWVTNFINYVGTGAEITEDVMDLMGDTYDNTKTLYDNLYQYVLPYSRTTVNQLDGSNIPISQYGRPIRNKNNLKLINEVTKTLNTNIDNLSDSAGFFNDKTSGAKQKDFYHASIFPSWFLFSLTPLKDCIPNHPDPYDYEPLQTTIFLQNDWVDGANRECHFYRVFHSFQTRSVIIWYSGSNTWNPGFTSSYSAKEWQYYWFNNGRLNNTYMNSTDYYVNGGWNNSSYNVMKVSGNTYIQDGSHFYYWSQETCTFYDLGLYQNFDDAQNNNSLTIVYQTTNNVVNSVEFTDYIDLINQLLLDVNMSNEVTNSLLQELLLELRTQNNNFVQNDGDDIYDYIDYMMQKLLEVKDIHIEIPDLTPDMGGIVDGITALLNFLASIIRTIGSLVETLLEGLFNLIVPTAEDWDDINLQLSAITAPLDWIMDFIAEAASNISLLLFGRNVTDFDVVESEDVELLNGNTTIDPDIVYDPNSGAPKIPVKFSNSSSEYFSNIENAYILDLNWYSPFKPVGDVIIVAFCWIMFIWRVFHGLPDIIQGGSGITDNSSVKTENSIRNFKGVGR